MVQLSFSTVQCRAVCRSNRSFPQQLQVPQLQCSAVQCAAAAAVSRSSYRCLSSSALQRSVVWFFDPCRGRQCRSGGCVKPRCENSTGAPNGFTGVRTIDVRGSCVSWMSSIGRRSAGVAWACTPAHPGTCVQSPAQGDTGVPAVPCGIGVPVATGRPHGPTSAAVNGLTQVISRILQ